MTGVRVRHATHRGGTYTVETPTSYPVPYDCPVCLRTHLYKAHHIDLDSEGYGMVSEGVLAELRKVGLAGLTIVNPVRKPPTLIIGGSGERQVVGSLILGRN